MLHFILAVFCSQFNYTNNPNSNEIDFDIDDMNLMIYDDIQDLYVKLHTFGCLLCDFKKDENKALETIRDNLGTTNNVEFKMILISENNIEISFIPEHNEKYYSRMFLYFFIDRILKLEQLNTLTSEIYSFFNQTLERFKELKTDYPPFIDQIEELESSFVLLYLSFDDVLNALLRLKKHYRF